MLTRAYLNRVLVDRNRPLLEAGELDATITDGTSPLIDDPISDAMQRLGLPVSDLSSPTDADLETVPSHLQRTLVHLAEIRLKRTILAALLVLVTQMVANDQTNFSDMASGLAREITRMEQAVLTFLVEGSPLIVVPLDTPTAPEEAPDLPVAWGVC